MHEIVGIIVEEGDENLALGEALCTLDGLTECNIYDYYSTEENDLHGMPLVTVATSELARDFIDKCISYTKEHYMQEISRIRSEFENNTDEQLCEEGFAFHFNRYNIKLYDQEREGIVSYKHLANCINGSGNKKKQVYLVVANVHY